MKNKTKLKLGISGAVAVFGLLAFVAFPYIGGKLVIKEQYTAAKTVAVDRKLESEMLFNNELNSSVFTDKLVEEIEKAQKTINVAIYSVDSEVIRDSLFAAAERGVKIQVVSDSKKRNGHATLFSNPPVNFAMKDVPEQRKKKVESYMHNKFAVIDAGEENQTVLTGAWNWTNIQEKIDPTYLLVTSDQEIVSAYMDEFERLFNGEHTTKKFKNETYKPFYRDIQYTDSNLEIWFSPGIGTNSIKNRIVDEIKTAEKSIDIMVWQVTDKEIIDELLIAAKNGVSITMLLDDEKMYEKDSAVNYMIEKIMALDIQNIELYSDETREVSVEGYQNLNSFLHHHMLLVDNKSVLFGTNNWGSRGAYVNDENIIVTNNKYIVESFIDTFKFQKDELADGKIEIL